MISYHTKLVGTSFRQESVAKVSPNKTPLRCVAETDNQYDTYAVRVEALLDNGWEQIGFIAKGKNQDIHSYLTSGGSVSIVCTDITGQDKDTLGANVGISYGDSGALDPVDSKDFKVQKVVYGDDDFIYFDELNHKAYDKDGNELLSGSNAEKMFRPEVNLSYPAKALSKSTGVLSEDIIAIWEHNRDLAADYGTVIHAALESYFTYAEQMRKMDENKEREHTAKNWMPESLGEIVDKFISTSGYKEGQVEIRIKQGVRTGIVDLLTVDGDGYILNDYKVTKKIGDIKYTLFGKMTKYSIQQNFYREILEESGLKINHMYLWQWDGEKWSKHELKRVNVKDNL